MFYAQELLTSRKHGVATVWLVATLGSKSTLRKVSRKAILDVDVAKACETIVEPAAPMALRLQSNLLYGVTRVYAQQCGYVLTDAENARSSMRALLKIMHHAELEPVGGNKGRVDQLLLQDDPNFLPDLDLLPANLENLATSINLNDELRSSVRRDISQSQITTLSEHSIAGLMIPPSISSSIRGAVGGLDLFRVRGDSGPGTATKTGPRLLDDDLGLVVNADGTLRVDDGFLQQPYAEGGEEGGVDLQTGHGQIEDRDEQVLDQQHVVYDGFNFAENVNFENGYAGNDAPMNVQNDAKAEDAQSTHSAMAPVRRRATKTPRVLSMDDNTTIGNGEIARFAANYLDRMQEASRHKQAARIATVARKNAEHWMLGSGTILDHDVLTPLDLFAGVKLLDAFTGLDLRTSEKRKRDDENESECGQKKRLRSTPHPDEAAFEIQQDEEFATFMRDDSIELGREQPTPLDDRHLSSIFPWNQSAGSRRPTDVHQPTSASLGGGPQLNLVGRPGSRLTSASPLVGRGQGNDYVYQDIPLPLSATDTIMGGIDPDDEFELYGAAAQVDTQTAAQSQWQRSTLTCEAANFLDFLRSAIDEPEQLSPSIAFEALLPPENNSCIVAAQAFLHVLALGTKDALKVEQEEPFSAINLRIVDAV